MRDGGSFGYSNTVVTKIGVTVIQTFVSNYIERVLDLGGYSVGVLGGFYVTKGRRSKKTGRVLYLRVLKRGLSMSYGSWEWKTSRRGRKQEDPYRYLKTGFKFTRPLSSYQAIIYNYHSTVIKFLICRNLDVLIDRFPNPVYKTFLGLLFIKLETLGVRWKQRITPQKTK